MGGGGVIGLRSPKHPAFAAATSSTVCGQPVAELADKPAAAGSKARIWQSTEVIVVLVLKAWGSIPHSQALINSTTPGGIETSLSDSHPRLGRPRSLVLGPNKRNAVNCCRLDANQRLYRLQFSFIPCC